MAALTEDLRIYLRTIADTRGVQQTQQALSDVERQATNTARSTQGLGRGLSVSGGDVLRFAGALTGLNIGLSAFTALGAAAREALDRSAAAFVDSQRIARATSAAYGEAAAGYTQFAVALSKQTGFTSNAILEAALSARTLSQNYGLTIQQTQRLIAVSADLASVRGIGIAEAFERVQSAIRGEAEASEYLGLTLNDTFIKNNAMNGSLRDTFERMSDTEKAQVRFTELLRQTATFSGLAVQGSKGLEGAQRDLARATSEFDKALGALIAPTLERFNREQADATSAATDFVKALQVDLSKTPFFLSLAQQGEAARKPIPQQAAQDLRFPLVPQVPPAPEPPRAAPPTLAPVPSDFTKAIDDITKTTLPAIRSQEDLKRAMDELTTVGRPVAPQQLLPHIVDETAQAADLSVKRLTSDLELLTTRATALGSLATALAGGGMATAGARAALQAATDLQKVEEALTAVHAAGSERDRLRSMTRVSDPRDAPGARAAQDQLRTLDQLEVAERDLLDLQQQQRDIQRARSQLAIQQAQAELTQLQQRRSIEAELEVMDRNQAQRAREMALLDYEQAQRARELAALDRQINDVLDERLRLQQESAHISAELASLPTQFAVEDALARLQRARLVAADRNQPADARREARAEIRGTERALPGLELAALDAAQALKDVERQQKVTGLEGRAAQIPLQLQRVDLAAQVQKTQDVVDAIKDQNQLIDLQDQQRRTDLQDQLKQGQSVVDAIHDQSAQLAVLADINNAAIEGRQSIIGGIIENAVQRALAAQTGTNQPPPTQIPLTVNINHEDGRTNTYAELLEANNQAAIPPVTQLSGVRRN